jgi:ribonuclease HII
MLQKTFSNKYVEAGCDEAGRGCLAGPVFGAAVILDRKFRNSKLNDSKKLSVKNRNELRLLIESEAVAWAVASVSAEEIDKINILNASFLAMHRALSKLMIKPGLLLIDGNRFNAYEDIPHHCIIKGDGKFMSIAAASILAKTYRDEYMANLHLQYPDYGWNTNKGYPTMQHKIAIQANGLTKHHRKTFNYHLQMRIEF